MKRIASLLFVVVVGLTGFAATSPDQDDGAGESLEQARPPIIQTVTLEHAIATEVAKAVQTALIDWHFAAVPIQSQNAILIKGPEPAIKQALELIHMLDARAQTQQSSRIVAVYDVRDLYQLNSIRRFLPIIVEGPDEQFVIEQNGMLVVSAREKTHTELRSILDQLRASTEDQPTSMIEGDRRIQVLWLLSGVESSPSMKTPESLQPVLDELEAHGYSELQVVANTLVETMVGERFAASSTLMLDNRIQFQLGGQMVPLSDRHQLDLEIIVEGASMNVSGQAMNTMLETSITVRDDHYVVLSAAPIADRQSAFVVRITKTD